MEFTAWQEIDVQLRSDLDNVVAELKAAGAADFEIEKAVQAKLDQLEETA